MDNLLVRHVPGEEINLAAIDNGLAFPVRHPECTSRFRSFPFRWSNLPWAQGEFDPVLRRHVLSLLTPQFVHRLCVDLKVIESDISRIILRKKLNFSETFPSRNR